MILLGAIIAGAAVWWAAEVIAAPARPAREERVTMRAARAASSRRAHSRPSRQVWLSQAGAAVTPLQFWAVCAIVGVTTFLVVGAIDGALAAAVMPGLAAAAIPYGYWSAQRRHRAEARAAAWPEAIREISGRLGAGVSTVHDALEELARTGPPALRPAMARYGRLANRVGQAAALEAVRAELADPITDPVLLALEMAVEEGSDQVLRILADLTQQIEADLQLGERIRTLQTQSRVATWAVFSVPYALLVFLCASQPFYRQFFSGPAGAIVLAFGGALSVTGLWVARRLGRPIPTSQRVFVGPANQ